MVFSSVPPYLDPANWHQHQNHPIIGSSGANPLLPLPPPPPPPPPLHGQPQAPPHGGVGSGSVRPGSMAERARMANLSMPETAMKCPRCESMNTKFCYFNNYSLSQPRHFCKTCRRYWTRGGALRSVPVGGGCRRNKRSKPASSKSPATGEGRTTSSGSTNTVCSGRSGSPANILGITPPQLPPLPFTSSLNHFPENNLCAQEMGMINSCTGAPAPAMGTSEMNYQIGRSLFGAACGGIGGASLLFPAGGGSGGMEHWRLQPQVQHFPFLGGLDPSPHGMYNHFQSCETGFVVGESSGHQPRPKPSSSMLTQMASVKSEENQAMSLSRQLMDGMPVRNDNQWNPNPSWTDLSSTNFSSFSTSSS